MFNNDEGFVTRQIKSLSKALSTIMFDKALPENMMNEKGIISEEDFLSYRIRKLIKDGKINEAENILFNEIKNYKSEENLKIALKFYEELNKLDDEILEKDNFLRIEILEGLDEIKNIYSIKE